MFKIGDYAVCPGHGVGQVCEIEDKDFGEETKSFYIVKIIANGMTIMVPTDSENGIRVLVESDDINDVFNVLNDHDIKIDNSTWNRRYREYMLKIKTGSLVEIAEVLRALFLLRDQKSLSFGEKKMLDQCRELLAQEISLAGGEEVNAINDKINGHFTAQPEQVLN